MTNDIKIIHQEELRIHAIECDFKRQWKPSSILQHLTEVAGIHAELLGVGFDFMYAQNLFWVHSRMRLKFIHLPRAGDQVTIRTWPKTILRRLLYIRDFEVLGEIGEKLITASSAWVIINATTHRLAPPKSVNLNLPALPDQVGLDEPLDRLDLARHGVERLRLQPGYSSVDIVGHVNNSRYIDWICDAFPIDQYSQHELDWLQINYEQEVLPGEEISVLVNPVEDQPGVWALEGRNLTNDTRAFEAALRWRNTLES
jgi:acyl-ACP thioesterase